MPVAYLRVKFSVRVWYDYIYPLLFAVPVGTFLARTSLHYNIVGVRGLVETFNGLLALLVGFFIAALAAVATFNRDGMDRPMLGDGATLAIEGRAEPLALTRRLFLCLLFAYLTLATLAVYLSFSIANVVLANATLQSLGVSTEQYALARATFIYIYCFALGHIVSHSLLGVYYLSWRTIIADAEIIEPKAR